jgi:galactokinase/mevalonate kinase-like predicted kinase
MIRTLLSVPPRLDRFVHSRGASVLNLSPETSVGSDPAERKLGSGGGSVHLLHEAWRSRPRHASQPPWSLPWQSLILHAGGESRRLPSYAHVGKALLPIPRLDGEYPRRFDQTLSDFQLPCYAQAVREAGPKCAAMVASGDVWLDFNALQIPPLDADIAGVGMRVVPEVAQHFGVFFVARRVAGQADGAKPIAFFRQKPSPAEIYRQLATHDFFVDTGLWLLSSQALQFLFRRCGWNDARNAFATADRLPAYLDLYGEIGPALGTRAVMPARLRRLGFAKLSSAVVPLETARFHHLGSSRQLFESFEQLLQRGEVRQRKTFSIAAPVEVSAPPAFPVWADNVEPGAPVRLAGFNLLSGRPAAAPLSRLGLEQCVDVVPVGAHRYAVRPFALDDTLRGDPKRGAVVCGRPADQWLAERGLVADCRDVFELKIYPVLPAEDITDALIAWYFATAPDPEITAKVRKSRRLSAAEIPAAINFTRWFDQRRRNYATALLMEFNRCAATGNAEVFEQDFAAIARFGQDESPALRRWLRSNYRQLLRRLTVPAHQSRLLMTVGQLESPAARKRFDAAAHERLREAVVATADTSACAPVLSLKEDQIVWSRSPVRLDLAGGWTDTPPYCLEHGGAVVNMAVLLNGQLPIQVFVRRLREPVISLRSIDLGASETLITYSQVASFRDARSGFSLPKAALAMAGFHPDFAVGKSYSTLKGRLAAFGGGLEISLLSAVPKGSGLGTSSILGATLLGALNRACGLGWDEVSLYSRVLAVEQLLTTGGGWQDQAGALFRGVKLIQTSPGASQAPSVRFLPGHLFDATHANRTLLLYYTGLTRLAKAILKEIVEDMFLARFETLQTLTFIRQNAFELFTALQKGDRAGLHRCIARSWDLNKRLDPGTTTPEIERILRCCGPDLTAAKLLGAGGGGYMLFCARDVAAGTRIRERLEAKPPNSRARFIDFELADHGLQVSVS